MKRRGEGIGPSRVTAEPALAEGALRPRAGPRGRAVVPRQRAAAVAGAIVLVTLLSFLAGPVLAAAFGTPPTPESLIGEQLEFEIRWGVVPAGRATLTVSAPDPATLVLTATARSHRWVDWFYPVRDRVESTVRLPGLQPERYVKNQKEGRGKPKLVEVDFDLAAGVARYRRQGEDREPLPVPPDVLDPLTSFYAFRTLELEGDEAKLRISDGKKVIDGVVLVHGREQITTRAGTFDTVKIEPRLEGIGGVFRKSPGARIFIWLTDDGRRRPVRLRSKVAVGHFTADLMADTLRSSD